MFLDEVHDYQSYVVDHLYLLGDHYSLLSEQFHVRNKIIDILAYNSLKECLTIIELKNPQATCRALSQILSYYYLLKDSLYDNLIISNLPECFIIAPAFSSKLILPESPIIRLYKFDNKLCNFEDVSATHLQNSKSNLDIKTSRQLCTVPAYLTKLITRLSSALDAYYAHSLRVIKQDNKISFLNTETKRIMCKIIIPFDWLASYVTLCLYNQFALLSNISSLDPAIIKLSTTKTAIKLVISDIPQFLHYKCN